MAAVQVAERPTESFESASTDTALMEIRKVLRVERRLFFLNCGISFLVAMVLRYWKLAGVEWFVTHMLAMWVTEKHPDTIAIYLRYRHQADMYRAWVSESPKFWRRNRRPEGFGRI